MVEDDKFYIPVTQRDGPLGHKEIFIPGKLSKPTTLFILRIP